MGKKGKGLQGACIKDPWTKPKGGRIEGGRWGKVVAGKRRQLYLNNNKTKERALANGRMVRPFPLEVGVIVMSILKRAPMIGHLLSMCHLSGAALISKAF